MPQGLMPQIIVALNAYISDISLVWNNGLNVELENTFAEIKKNRDYNNKFLIRIFGNKKKQLLNENIGSRGEWV